MSVPKAPMATPRPMSSAAATAVIRRSDLPHAAEVRRQVCEGLVRNRLHELLLRLEVRVAGTALVRLEGEHLLEQIPRGLAAQIGNDLGGVTAAAGAMAGRALGGRCLPAR